MRRTTITALLAAVVLALAGCSDSGGGKPAKATATVTKTPKVDAAGQRKACVAAWAELLQENADASVDDAPSECGKVPEGDRLDAYMDGLQQRNHANRDDAKECLEDPTCTALPVP